MTVVRHNLDTHRVVTACDCGRTVSLPDGGISETICACGRGWRCDGQALGMYEPKDRREERES